MMVVYDLFFFEGYGAHRDLHLLTHSFPTRRSSDLLAVEQDIDAHHCWQAHLGVVWKHGHHLHADVTAHLPSRHEQQGCRSAVGDLDLVVVTPRHLDVATEGLSQALDEGGIVERGLDLGDRTSGGLGQSVSVRVDLGGRRILSKKSIYRTRSVEAHP